ncbi:MAG: AAA family ATPase [Thermoanaerobaculia bacterium]|nr:AAA family ATPase [Thermoanaerobaculia bacterium]
MAVSQEVIDRIVGNVRKRYPGWEGVNDSRFQEEEVRYKREASKKAASVLSSRAFSHSPSYLQMSSDERFDLLQQKLRSLTTNLLFLGAKSGDLSILYQVSEKALQWEFVDEFSHLIDKSLSPERRVGGFVDWAQQNGLLVKWTFVTYFPFLLEPKRFLFVKPTVIEWLFGLVGPENYPRRPSQGGYSRIHALAFQVMERLRPYGARDWIDFQSIVWVAHQVEHEGTQPVVRAGTSEQQKNDLRGKAKVPSQASVRATLDGESPKEEEPTPPAIPHPAFPLPAVAARTHLPTQTLERWLRAIRRKGQAVLYGPPGTGKTYVAKALAEHLVGGADGIFETLQFHPSFGYEDFMEGLRPERSAAGGLDYKVRRGRFVEFCDRAQLHAGTSVLILDEINRANLARVFGELLYLLEYRDQSILLPSGRPFSIPKQVVILGTMNTADRSIALVDHALRRRFAFLRVPPQPETLRQFHAQAGTAEAIVERLIGLLDRINLAIGDAHYHLGVSFFLLPDLADHLEDIWELEIEPFLEEYFFDRPETLAGFRWQQVREGLI